MWAHQLTTGSASGTHVFATLGGSSWLWSLSRTSGVVAVILLVLLAISGIGQVTGLSYRILEPLPAWTLHRALATALGTCILIHAAALLLYASSMSLVTPALTPFAPSTLDNLDAISSLAVAVGLLIIYLAAIFILTAVFWHNAKPLGPRLTRYLLCVGLIIVFLCGLYANIPILAFICGVGIAISAFIRLTKGPSVVGGL